MDNIMKKKIAILVLVCSLCMTIICIVFSPSSKDPYQEKQELLADKLDVKITEYPYQRVFPIGYFDTVLVPGMSLGEVHDIVNGYEKVYHCGMATEIYYYFSNDTEEALVFMILYDRYLKYGYLLEVGSDSTPIRLDGCEEGLLSN